jgi:hypothetical protein
MAAEEAFAYIHRVPVEAGNTLAGHRDAWRRIQDRTESQWCLILEEGAQIRSDLSAEAIRTYLAKIPSNAALVRFGYCGRHLSHVPVNSHWCALQDTPTGPWVAYAIRPSVATELVGRTWTHPLDSVGIPF